LGSSLEHSASPFLETRFVSQLSLNSKLKPSTASLWSKQLSGKKIKQNLEASKKYVLERKKNYNEDL